MLGDYRFSSDELGEAMTIGAGDDCDWQITGPGTCFRELQVLVDEAGMHVRPLQHEHHALLDGRLLGPGWASARDGSRLDFGDCCISVAVSLERNDVHADSGVRMLGVPTVVVDGYLGEMDAWERSSEPVEVEASVADRATPQPAAEEVPEPEAEMDDIASVLRAPVSRRRWLTPGRVSLALSVVAAYGAWVALLDVI